jgi:glyoxylase I family protein
MSSTFTEPGTASTARQGLRPPARMHHHNFYTEDLEATRHFYEDIAGLPLKAFVIEPVPESQGSEWIGHAFFGLADGGFMAFMHYSEAAIQATMVGTEQPGSVHIALKIDNEQQMEILKRVKAAGYEHFLIDHGIIRSLYVRDPNRLLVEFGVDPDGYEEIWRNEAERAHEMMRKYLAGDHTPTAPKKKR